MVERFTAPMAQPVDLERSCHLRRRADILTVYGGFDEAWYRGSYPDADFFGGSAIDHFLLFGAGLGRGISRAIPRLAAEPELESALLRAPTVSYCIPIMNRPDDIRGTLRANLDENRAFGELVEFVLAFLDDDVPFHTWIRQEFAAEIHSGYLRVIEEQPLPIWHFGRAKNAHRKFASGKVFSSLDGDNFVTRQETEQLLQIFERFGPNFIFHHFSGNWGDGTSGRVSSGMHFYEEVGYDESFLPRQYDEMDFILSTLHRYPGTPLLRLSAENHGLSSKRSQSFIKKSRLKMEVIEVDPVERRPPLNPKGGDYVDGDRLTGTMQTFNQALCFSKNSPTASLRNEYITMAQKARHALLDEVPRSQVIKMIFGRDDFLPRDFAVGPHDVCVFSCVKDDEVFLPALYQHYKALGVRYFFLVDDRSAQPIRQTLPYDDVIVVEPTVGNFATAKTLWLEALMKGTLGDGQWALTIDADEFLDLPAPYTSLTTLAKDLAARGADFAPGVLIDVIPRELSSDFDQRLSTDGFEQIFDHLVWMDQPPTEDYLSSQPIRWGFGPFASISWALDIRYHAFGTLDTLRKIPLLRIQPRRHLNQGFHSLHNADGTEPGTEIWEHDILLPIRHFKLLKLFSEAERYRIASQLEAREQSQYHARTTDNIRRIFGDEWLAQVERLMALPRRVYTPAIAKLAFASMAKNSHRCNDVEPQAMAPGSLEPAST